jgi:hypothetical protein
MIIHNIKVRILYLFFLITIFNLTKAQEFIQTIHGRIIDIDSKVSIPGATRVTEQIQPPIGTVADTLDRINNKFE